MAFTFRDKKGSPLTSAEGDANIRQLLSLIGRTAFFNIEAFGAVADTVANRGLVDNTDAVLTAIRACEAAGGGVVFVPARTYYCNKFSSPNNAVLWLQQAPNTVAMNSVCIEGEYPVAGIPYNTPPTTYGSIIASNAAGVDKYSAILSAGKTTGNGAPNYVSLVTKNLTFRTKDNPSLGCVNAYYAACYEGISCMCDTGVNQFALALPTGTVAGFVMPAINNYGIARLTNCWVGGYPVGVNFSEHFMSDDTKILRCKTALYTDGSYHTAAGTFNIFHCPVILKTTGAIPVDFHFDLERSNDNAWWDYRQQGGVEVVNTGAATGIIRYAFTKAQVGTDLDPITTSGAGNIQYINLRNPVNDVSIANKQVSGFSASRNASTPSTVDLSWYAEATTYDGYQIIYREDGGTYPAMPQISVTNGASGSVQATGVDATKRYEFSIRGTRNGSFSQYVGGVFVSPAGAGAGMGGLLVEENDPGLTYNTFTAVGPGTLSNGVSGNMRTVDKDLNAFVKYTGSFTASGIDVNTITFPDCYSSMDVLIDNKLIGSFNPITASRVNGVQYTFSFPSGTYSEVLIRPSASATFDPTAGGHFYFDSFRVY